MDTKTSLETNLNKAMNIAHIHHHDQSLEKIDLDLLQWVHDRMYYKHGENINADYMHALRRVIVRVDGAIAKSDDTEQKPVAWRYRIIGKDGHEGPWFVTDIMPDLSRSVRIEVEALVPGGV